MRVGMRVCGAYLASSSAWETLEESGGEEGTLARVCRRRDHEINDISLPTKGASDAAAARLYVQTRRAPRGAAACRCSPARPLVLGYVPVGGQRCRAGAGRRRRAWTPAETAVSAPSVCTQGVPGSDSSQRGGRVGGAARACRNLAAPSRSRPKKAKQVQGGSKASAQRQAQAPRPRAASRLCLGPVLAHRTLDW